MEKQDYMEFEIKSGLFIVEDSEGTEFGGFTTAATFSSVASWFSTFSSASSFSSSGD
jgi:hypothetical protein